MFLFISFRNEVELGFWAPGLLKFLSRVWDKASSSAEIERVFSSFTRTLSKERLSLKNQTIENLLILRSNNFDNFDASKYSSIATDFLTHHPDGTLKKKIVAGQNCKKRKKRMKRKKTKKNCLFLNEDIIDDNVSHSGTVSSSSVATVKMKISLWRILNLSLQSRSLKCPLAQNLI